MFNYRTLDFHSLWYLVGLITTDGCLSKDGRHIDITSSDYSYLKYLIDTLKMQIKIGKKRGSVSYGYHIQISSVDFYRYLESIGLHSKKSLTLGALKVPKKYFHDFLRGVIDGDGSIFRWLHPQNGGEQWSLRITSGAKIYSEWLIGTINQLFGVVGRLHKVRSRSSILYIIKYGKVAAQKILKRCYYTGAIAMKRKHEFAQSCINSQLRWSKSRTVTK